jgi:sulfur-oxidizing protein SoxY
MLMTGRLEAGAKFSRRETLALGASAAAFAIAPAAQVEAQTVEKAMAEIARFTGGAEPLRARVDLDLPAIAENGNAVPISIVIESPMTPEAYVERLIIVTTANPYARALGASFTPASGRAELTTRIRLAATQEIFAVAKMSDGTFYIDSKTVKVTVGGCGG